MQDYRLVYYSTNRLQGSRHDLIDQVEAILSVSRRNNNLVGVTGALLFTTNYFGQVLEGPLEAVEATFERIQQDDRHGDVAMLEFVPIEERSFGNWSMAFVGKSSDWTTALDAIANSTAFDPETISGEALFVKLRDLVAASGSAFPA